MKFRTTAGEQLGTVLLSITLKENDAPFNFVLTTGEAKHLGFVLAEGIGKAALALGMSVTPDEHSSCAGGFCKPMGVIEAEARHDEIAQERASSCATGRCGK